jgi:ribonuclease T1
VRIKGRPKLGYVGGRKFKNLERKLPIIDNKHLKISYQEWDINRKIAGKNRGTERLVTASDGSDYYTNDHYKSFQKLLEK